MDVSTATRHSIRNKRTHKSNTETRSTQQAERKTSTEAPTWNKKLQATPQTQTTDKQRSLHQGLL
eukprot:1293282-Amphidinium_carterae.1